MRFVVTIDGPAAAGKSTTARAVAARLGFLYLDTGALYRALAYQVLEQGVSPDDAEAVARCADGTELDLSGSPDQPEVWLDGREVSAAIRSPVVSELSSRLAAQPAVRQRLIEIQRTLGNRGPVVAEGRDLGTVVFPDAEVKIFLDADIHARAGRRCRELQECGLPVELEQVQKELERRDERDRGRAQSPLRPASDATVIDTTRMGIEEQVQAVLSAVEAHPRCAGLKRTS
jgi:cytidylate kinase